MYVPAPCEFDLDKLVIKLDEVVSSDLTAVDDAVAKIMSLIQGRWCRDSVENVDLALREALVNAIIHGSKCDPKKAVRVCAALAEDCSVLIVVKDGGGRLRPERASESRNGPEPVVVTRKRNIPH